MHVDECEEKAARRDVTKWTSYSCPRDNPTLARKGGVNKGTTGMPAGLFSILIFLFLFFSSLNAGIITKRVCIKDVCLEAEVADSPEKQMQGLMFRKVLADNQGMLFVFNAPDKYAFWMKNVEFPLDIIWINQDKVIIDIKTNVQPCKDSCEVLNPQEKAKYVLEVNARFIEKNQVKIGDRVVF
jgi:hypothetical protein